MTTFNAYYQSELNFLRDSGRTFSKAYPDAAKYLAEAGSDPDVERLLEGVAFLTGRIRQRLDDGLPEITHTLIEALLPHYLRPLPSISLVQFSSLAPRRDPVIIPVGSLVEAEPREGTVCRFRTTHAVHVTPLAITGVRHEAGPPARIVVDFSLPEGAVTTAPDRVRLYLSDDALAARALHLCLALNDGISLVIAGQVMPSTISAHRVGLTADEALLPHQATASDSHRLLIEWFAFPQRFQAIDLLGIFAALPQNTTRFSLCFALTTHARSIPPVGPLSLLLHTTPVVNLFSGEAEPLYINGRSTIHRVRPALGDPKNTGIYAVTKVVGRVNGSALDLPMERRWHRIASANGTWLERRRPAVLGHGADVELDIANPPLEHGPLTLSLDVWCTNRDLPTQLGIGDIRRPGQGVPAGVAVKNLLVPTAPIEPSLCGDLPWRLLGHLSLDRTTLLTLEGLREAFSLYDLRAHHDQTARHAHQRLCDSLLSLTSERAVRMLDGIPIRGLAVTLIIDEERLGGIAEVHLFSAVLDIFISGSVSLNAFTRLTIRCSRSGFLFTWPDRLGRKRLL